MAMMTLNIPDDIEQRFNRVFADADPSTVVAKLMADAIAKQERQSQSSAAVRRVIARRSAAPPTTLAEILDIRDALRVDSDSGHESSAR